MMATGTAGRSMGQKRRALAWFQKWAAFHTDDGDFPGLGYKPDCDPRRPAVGEAFAAAAERLRRELREGGD